MSKKLIGLLLLFALPIEGRATSYPDVPWGHMTFVTPQVGHCWGDRGLLRTEDGGRSWSFLNEAILRTLPYWGAPEWPDDREDPSPCLKPVFHVSFVTPQIGWISSLGNLLSTTDGGQTWEDLTRAKRAVPSGKTDYFIHYLQFTSERTGWMMGEDSLFRTDDGGRSWKWARETSAYKAWFSEKGEGLLLNRSGVLETTVDGEHWRTLQLPIRVRKPDAEWFVLDASNWWVTEGDSVFQTSDAGTTWNVISYSVTPGARCGETRLSPLSSDLAWMTIQVRTTPDTEFEYGKVLSRLYQIRAGEVLLLQEHEDCLLIPVLRNDGEGLMIITGPLSEQGRKRSAIIRSQDRGRKWEQVFENRCYR